MWIDRRRFLKNSALISLTPALPAFLPNTLLAADKEDNGRILVVIQLDGGNDGINTVVPFRDEGYAANRQELLLAEKDLIKLTDDLAFHPRSRSASELFQEARLSVVQGVGYPNPNRSHFRSMAIWHTANPREDEHTGNGWIGEAISAGGLTPGPHAIHVGKDDLPVALRGRRCTATTISNPADLKLTLSDLADIRFRAAAAGGGLSDYLTRSVGQAYASAKELAELSAESGSTGARYPGSKLAKRLKLVGQMIKSDAAARVYYTSQGGYDTHAVQLPSHGNLLGELSSSLKAFMNDMRESGLEDRILVMAFSEFGRRVKENASLGTDHGTAGPVFLAGTQLNQRVYGKMPPLTDLDAGDLKHTLDFRHVYAGILRDWLAIGMQSGLHEYGDIELVSA